MWCETASHFSHKTEQSTRGENEGRKKNQLMPVTGVLNACRHNLYRLLWAQYDTKNRSSKDSREIYHGGI